MVDVVREYKPYFQAVTAFNRQTPEVRARVVSQYFDIAATDMKGDSRHRLICYGHRARMRPGPKGPSAPRPLRPAS